jgi:hypothetical protein
VSSEPGDDDGDDGGGSDGSVGDGGGGDDSVEDAGGSDGSVGDGDGGDDSVEDAGGGDDSVGDGGGSGSGDDGGDSEYVHRPGAARDHGEADRDGGDGESADGSSGHGASPAAGERTLPARRGWVLIGVLAFCLLVVPLVILWRPPGLPYWVALLALPMLPAFLLGAVGVWATTRP